ncbi:MAG: RIP metalloprotease RseP [Negativicutes bacterium]|nr:RIP metalloprotease RseP [Negativicutes bacterium]
MLTFVAVVFVFGLLISVHEIGHLILAKLTGMHVSEFALGFGPAIARFTHGETVYVVRLFPLGGYNKIEGMTVDEATDDRAFVNKPLTARLAVIVAGSVMNLVLPVVLLSVVFLSDGISRPAEQAVIGEVIAGQAADKAGIMANDRIVSIDGNPVGSWQQFVDTIRINAGKNLHLVIERGQSQVNISVVPVYDEKQDRGMIGAAPLIINQPVGLWQALTMSAQVTGQVIAEMVKGIYAMVAGRAPADVSGPLGIIKITGEVAEQGWTHLLRFAAFLSINLGMINLLPLPLLDGGHVIMLLIEGVRRRPLPPVSIKYIQIVGVAILLTLMIFATVKDINRMF